MITKDIINRNPETAPIKHDGKKAISSHCLEKQIKMQYAMKTQGIRIFWCTSIWPSAVEGLPDTPSLTWDDPAWIERGKKLRTHPQTLQHPGQTEHVKKTLWRPLCFQLEMKQAQFPLPVSGVWKEPCLATASLGLPSRKSSHWPHWHTLPRAPSNLPL